MEHTLSLEHTPEFLALNTHLSLEKFHATDLSRLLGILLDLRPLHLARFLV